MAPKRWADLDVLQSYPGGARFGVLAVVQVPLGPDVEASGMQATYSSCQSEGTLQLSLEHG